MNDDRDYLDLSDIPEHLQELRILEHKARWRLNETLNAAGIDTPADQLFINSDDGNGVVLDHASLVDMAVKAMQEGLLPNVTEPYSGLFTVRASFDDTHRVGDQLSLADAMDMVADVYAQLQV